MDALAIDSAVAQLAEPTLFAVLHEMRSKRRCGRPTAGGTAA